MARVVLNKREVYKLLASPNGDTARYLVRKAYQVQNKARVNCPVDSGNLRGSITHEIAQDGGGLSARVGTNVPYAIYVHEGTGIYAGRGYITPKKGKFLAWKGGGGWVFAKRVRGQKANPFLRDALNSVF